MRDPIPSEIIIKKLGVAERLTEKAIGMGARITSPRDLKKQFREIYNAITEAVNANDYGKGSGEPDSGLRQDTAGPSGHGGTCRSGPSPDALPSAWWVRSNIHSRGEVWG